MPKLPQTGQASLFETERVKEAPSADLKIERPYDHAQLFLGTSAFTANGWAGVFYPPGMKQTEYLSHYAKTFRAVEIDSTFYGTPIASTVESWYRKTPPDFVFASKVPQVVTHEKALKDYETKFDEFVGTMGLLKEKLGPMLLQSPKFSRFEFKTCSDFLARLRPFLKRLPDKVTQNLVVEIRNPSYLNGELSKALTEHKVCLALTDTSFMPRAWELKVRLCLCPLAR
jgi:uncharacterized protein YecE (DUF72 family)